MSYDKCKKVKKILQNHCVRYEEKDLYKNKEFQRELKYRLNLKQIDVPHVFFDGKHIGVRLIINSIHFFKIYSSF
jgi:glutaredoxin